MTMYNEAYGSAWAGNQPPHRWFSADCYASINMAERHQREDFSLWPPVQASTPVGADTHSPMSSAADLFKWKTSNPNNHGPPHDYNNISSDAMNNNLHNAVRHESSSSTSSYRSNGAHSELNSPTTPINGNHSNATGAGPSLVIPQPVKPVQQHTKTGNKTYQCKMCDQIFSTKSDMLVHYQQIHKQDMKTFSPSAFRCPQCQKCFANSSYLSQHNRIHAGIKPYKCEICERKFTQLSHLQQHIRTHTGEKPYKCHHPGCGKAFSQLSNLQSHSRSHMTDKPYRCNSCYKCYATEAGLREHIPKHSETKHIKTQICKICGKAYTQETYLARHMLKHTGENAKLQQNQNAVKQEPSDHSNLDGAVDFTRILDRIDKNNQDGGGAQLLKGPGSSVPSAFMPLSPFCTTSSNTAGYPYGSGLNTGLSSALSSSNLSPSLPHISSMSNPRYFPYDPLGYRKDPVDRLVNDRLVNDRLVNERLANDRLMNDRLVNDRLVNDRLVNDRLVNDRLVNDRLVNERLERNMNVPITSRPESMLANSFLSLQQIKNYASQQMPAPFSPCPSGNSRLT